MKQTKKGGVDYLPIENYIFLWLRELQLITKKPKRKYKPTFIAFPPKCFIIEEKRRKYKIWYNSTEQKQKRKKRNKLINRIKKERTEFFKNNPEELEKLRKKLMREI